MDVQLILSANWIQSETILFFLPKETSELALELAFSPQRDSLEEFGVLCGTVDTRVGRDSVLLLQTDELYFSPPDGKKRQKEAVPCFLAILKPQTSFLHYNTDLGIFLNLVGYVGMICYIPI